MPGMPDRDFRGMSSHYVHTLREGDRLNVFLDSADGFHLQEDVTKPMIFVSAGTGLAPMRAFLWERLAMKQAGVPLAEAALFNGIRSSSLDYIYRDEIERFTAEGVLDHGLHDQLRPLLVVAVVGDDHLARVAGVHVEDPPPLSVTRPPPSSTI